MDTILLTGATGYVGGRLLGRLEALGLPVRCLARRPQAVRAGAPTTEVAAGDLLDPASLERAMQGVSTAYYLVHSMAQAAGFEQAERRGAENFARAARDAGVERIVYLGALGGEGPLSPHLASRRAVGRILRASGVPALEFRAAVVLGAGSLSFELVRALVERLPVMVTPRWVCVKTQPIAVDDVLAYLLAALAAPLQSAVYQIGGADRVSYLDMMKEYARRRGLHRAFLRVPVLTPWLSSRWLSLVTPVQARVGARLIEGIRHETVVTDPAALSAFPIRPRGLAEAMRLAVDGAAAKPPARRSTATAPAAAGTRG